MKRVFYLFSTSFLIACSGSGSDQNAESADNAAESTNDQAKGYPTEVYFGDTHLHTELSMDAGAFGNTLGLDDAYRFAKGEEVTSSTGLQAKLSRPLDFLVVSDHSDGMGLFQSIRDGDENMMKYETGKRWHDMINGGQGPEAAIELIKAFSQGEMEMNPNDPKLQRSVWAMTVEAAERHNEPGKFTAFIGYEWTSLIKGNNLHRVVIYRDNGDKTSQHIPYNMTESPDPEDLWKDMQAYEEKTGGKVLAIPHNGNMSNGMLFAQVRVNGEAYTPEYAQTRNRWEPLYEITQIKGDGEAHPFLSPNDEFADYETWDFGNLDLSEVKTNDMLEGEYGRSALRLGLKFKKDLGTNPYKVGFIGSTDAHTSLATADENNFFNKAAHVEPSKDRWEHVFVDGSGVEILSWELVASGYAAVWAQENTRESLWDAMMRKETYATTGPRMKVRFFGGWDFTEDDLNGDWVKAGYERGVPMGGDLSNGKDKTPSFILHAMMDPEGGSLDRIQVIKGWLNPDGTTDEKVYNVVWSGDRQMDENGKVPLVENTVNVSDGSWDNTSGAAELSAVWSDPDFDPALEAFYYVRVIEIPTPRWTLYDVLNYGAEMPDDIPMSTTERAYTSSIWYSPM